MDTQAFQPQQKSAPKNRYRSDAEEKALLDAFTRVHKIMDAARGGDKAAFAEIIELLTPIAEGQAKSRRASVKRTSLEGHLTTDIFLAAALQKITEIVVSKKSDDFKSPAMLRNFTMTSIRNHLINVVRKEISQRRLMAAEPIVIDAQDIIGSHTAKNPPISSEDPDILHSQYERKKAEVLEELKTVLTPDQFKVFSLHIENIGAESKDIGHALGMHETAVRSHLMRGRKKIEDKKRVVEKLEDILSADMPTHRERAMKQDSPSQNSR